MMQTLSSEICLSLNSYSLISEVSLISHAQGRIHKLKKVRADICGAVDCGRSRQYSRRVCGSASTLRFLVISVMIIGVMRLSYNERAVGFRQQI